MATAANLKSFLKILEALACIAEDQSQKGDTRREANNITNKMEHDWTFPQMGSGVVDLNGPTLTSGLFNTHGSSNRQQCLTSTQQKHEKTKIKVYGQWECEVEQVH